LARRATFYEQSRSNADLRLIVDAGAFSRGIGEIGKLRSEYMVKAMAMLGYDVVNLSARDLSNGGEFIKNLAKNSHIKFISANIYYKDSGKLFTKPYVIVKLKRQGKHSGEWKELKVGIIGLCEERATLFNDSIHEKMLQSRNPIVAAKVYVPKLHKKSDLVLLLAHMKYNVLQQVLSEVQGIDIVAFGGGYYRKPATSEQEGPIIVKTQNLGKYVGQLMLKIGNHKKIISHTASTIALDEKIADHPELAKLVQEAEAKEREYRQRKRDAVAQKRALVKPQSQKPKSKS